MLRTLFVPAILAGIISTPFLMPLGDQNQASSARQLPASPAGFVNYDLPQSVQASVAQQSSPFRQASQQRIIQTQPPGSGSARSGLPVTHQGFVAGSDSRTVAPGLVPAQSAGYNPGSSYRQPAIAPGQAAGYADWGGPILDENNNVIGMVPGNGIAGGVDPAALGFTPDYGAAQTFSFGGNASGPNLGSPLQFTPVFDFAEIFNYGVKSAWVGQRWDRVSNVPVSDGLRGKRVALVTGTNSWDLHGSLTYYFDEYQKCRRITFRGWAGDPGRLIEILTTKHGLKQQPTHWEGFYVAKSWRKSTGAMLMKSPTVTYVDNKVQQIGVLLELNDPSSKHQLSEDFVSLIRGSQQAQ